MDTALEQFRRGVESRSHHGRYRRFDSIRLYRFQPPYRAGLRGVPHPCSQLHSHRVHELPPVASSGRPTRELGMESPERLLSSGCVDSDGACARFLLFRLVIREPQNQNYLMIGDVYFALIDPIGPTSWNPA
jgi:hypothetical protein